jgi:FixJ family two-component response regulator
MSGIIGTVFIADDNQDVPTAPARLLTANYRVHLFDSAEHFLEEQAGYSAIRASLAIETPKRVIILSLRRPTQIAFNASAGA